MSNPWIFNSDQLNDTPSIRDGISKKAEIRLRLEGAKFIQSLGSEKLKLHYSTVATAAVFFHRFYMFYSFKMFPVYPMATTCLFLAGKVEETPKKSNDIIRLSKDVLRPEFFVQFGADPKDELFTLERILLQTLRFDLEVEHPYEHLVRYFKDIKSTPLDPSSGKDQKELLQAAWTFVNDSCCTTVCLQFEPEIVAVAMVFLACKTAKFEVNDWNNRTPGQRHWWDAYVDNLDETLLEEVCHQLLDVYSPLQVGGP